MRGPSGRFLAAIWTLLLAHLCGRAACAEDWPQWRGIHRDGRSAETGLLKTWPEGGPPLEWAVSGLGSGWGSAVVAEGTVYVTGMVDEHDVLFAFATDGRPKWQQALGPSWTKNYRGARYPPTIDDGRAYVLTSAGLLVCLDAATGDQRWSVSLPERFKPPAPKWGWAEAPLVHAGKVICTPGAPGAALAALDAEDGQAVWTTEGLDDRAAYGSAILIQRGGLGLAVAMTGNHVVGVDVASGRVAWKHPYQNVYADHPVTPVHSGGLIYATGGYGTGGLMLRLAPDGRSVRLGWTDTTLDCLHSGVVLVDGHVYGSGHRNGGWVCLELASGEVKHDVHGTPRGSVIWADGMLYCYGQRGDVALVKATPPMHDIVSQFRVRRGEGRHWAHPALSDGRLYIRHGDALMAYDVRGPRAG